MSAGGVGRNITEALGKLGACPLFISTVGDDNNGDYLCSLLPKSSRRYVKRLQNYNTAQCIILFDSKGECKMLLGDMEVHAKITPEMIFKYEHIIKKCPLIILDGNLSIPSLDAALQLAGKYNVPVLFEPSDVPLASKPFQTSNWKSITFITPNLLELKEIAQYLKIKLQRNYTDLDEVKKAAILAKEVASYIPNIIVTLGSKGLLIARRQDAAEALLCKESGPNNQIQLRHYPVQKVPNIVNVSGAGDCLTSGLVVAMLKGLSEKRCISVGYAAASFALLSHSAIPDCLFDEKHQAWSSEAHYINL